MEVRSTLGVAWHGSRHFDTPPAGISKGSTGPAPVSRGQAILDSWAILSLLMKKINHDKARLSHGKKNT
jgi:hypothetical protein